MNSSTCSDGLIVWYDRDCSWSGSSTFKRSASRRGKIRSVVEARRTDPMANSKVKLLWSGAKEWKDFFLLCCCCDDDNRKLKITLYSTEKRNERWNVRETQCTRNEHGLLFFFFLFFFLNVCNNSCWNSSIYLLNEWAVMNMAEAEWFIAEKKLVAVEFNYGNFENNYIRLLGQVNCK